MHVMQYEITLPADYDMGIIERRVATRGHATDDFPHLGLKAYAVRRIGRHGSAVNAYAPFYLWRDPAGLNAFLYGPFRNIVADFGRPPVRHWVGASFHRGPASGQRPVFATRRSEPFTGDTPPDPAVTAPDAGVAAPDTTISAPDAGVAAPDTTISAPDAGIAAAGAGNAATTRGLHSVAVAVDPDRWEVVHFALWAAVPDHLDPTATGFDLLHASTPQLTELPTGRLW